MPLVKIRDFKSRQFYGVFANSLDDLKQKARSRFQFSTDDLMVHLEDGTIIDDEEYLNGLEPHTALVISEVNSDNHLDTTDAAVLNLSGDSDEQVLARLTFKLSQNISNIILFSTNDLELIANSEIKTLKNYFHLPNEEIERIQEACHNHLVEREKTTDALNLMEHVTEQFAASDRKRPKNS